MLITAISDTHEQFFSPDEMPEGDLLIHAGDFTYLGKSSAIIQFNNWLGEVKHKYKYGIVIIAGNHDLLFESNYYYAKSLITNAIYLQEEGIIIDGLNIFGSPIQPTFFNWAFNRDRGEQIKKHWAKIPEDTNILITHGPPKGILDLNTMDERCGCEDLLNRIKELKQLKCHIFGHLHSGYGKEEINGITYINASSCNEQYQLKNKPITIVV